LRRESDSGIDALRAPGPKKVTIEAIEAIEK
jgi:hypothetical protein